VESVTQVLRRRRAHLLSNIAHCDFPTDADHSWNDYPNPTLDAVLALFGIAVVVMVFRFLLSM
jgi:hypothetical protein